MRRRVSQHVFCLAALIIGGTLLCTGPTVGQRLPAIAVSAAGANLPFARYTWDALRIIAWPGQERTGPVRDRVPVIHAESTRRREAAPPRAPHELSIMDWDEVAVWRCTNTGERNVGSKVTGGDLAQREQIGLSRAVPGSVDRRAGPSEGSVVRLLELETMPVPVRARDGGVSLVAERMTYTPGASIIARRQTQMRMIFLEAGTLDVQIDGVATLERRWPASAWFTRDPERAMGNVHLLAGDLLAIAAESAFAVRNDGAIPAVSLDLSVLAPRPLTPLTDRIEAVTMSGGVRSERLTAMAAAPGEASLIVAGRVSLPPGRGIVVDAGGGGLFVAQRGTCGPVQNLSSQGCAAAAAELIVRATRASLCGDGETPLVGLLLALSPNHAGVSAD